MSKFQRFQEIIPIPVTNATYWKIFSEMHSNDPLSTMSDMRMANENLILVRLQNRKKIIAIECKDNLQPEVHKEFPGTCLKKKKFRRTNGR